MGSVKKLKKTHVRNTERGGRKKKGGNVEMEKTNKKIENKVKKEEC